LEELVILNELTAGRRDLAFCSEFGARMLENYGREIAIDGTFSVILLSHFCFLLYTYLMISSEVPPRV
jgi:hypothetical protein